jgi:hypothetical protein
VIDILKAEDGYSDIDHKHIMDIGKRSFYIKRLS